MNSVTNLTALETARQHGIHSTNYQKSVKKLSTGFKINCAADSAAELTISENMRAQIRGLNRSVINAEEGANFIQVGDGAMDEIHDMLHRMSELAVQSLNDTNTAADRAALAAEFNQLQSEIDRISKGTYYNTQPVFEEHEASYYQIAGNRQWAANQQHSVTAPDNNLIITLPDDGTYNPREYEITVPDGIYTTQELVDEIEDALSGLSPSNPGFVLEFTDEGFCNLNFEDPQGNPTKIDAAGGSLAYLIYDCYNGHSSASLLGTTEFIADRKLDIFTGINDTLSFYIEKPDGSGLDKPVTVTIPQGSYSRSEMIDLLNTELAKYSSEVTAKEYGSSCIQITGGASASITGLKGNMFTIEDKNSIPYTSVFYDNICPAVSTGSPASVTGTAYYSSAYTEKIKIDHTNDTLQIKLSTDSDYESIQLSRKEYTIKELADVLNDYFRLTGTGITASVLEKQYAYIQGIGSVYNLQYLKLESSTTGSDLAIEFNDADPVSSAAYDALFCKTTYFRNTSPSSSSGQDTETMAQIAGRPVLSTPITIAGGTDRLSFSIQTASGTLPVSLTIPSGTYSSVDDLARAINDSALTPQEKEKVQFAASGGHLVIQGKTNDVKSISGLSGSAYEPLFVSRREYYYTLADNSGFEIYNQGSTDQLIASKMASVTMPSEMQDPAVIDSKNDKMRFVLNGETVEITLAHGTYSKNSLFQEIRNKLSPYKVSVSLNNDRLTITTALTGTHRHPDTNNPLSISVSPSAGSVWQVLGGYTVYTDTPYPQSYSANETYLQGYNNDEQITLNDANRTFTFTYQGTDHLISLDAGTYNRKDLAGKLQEAIDRTPAQGSVLVQNNSSGIRFQASTTGKDTFKIEDPKQTGSFYDTVLSKHITTDDTGTPRRETGKHVFSQDGSFIIGREDISGKTVEIVKDLNDTFTLDLNYTPDPNYSAVPGYTKTLSVSIPPGTYTGSEIAEKLQGLLQTELNKTGENFDISVEIGGHSTGVTGSIDDRALQITIKEHENPDGTTTPSNAGTYVLDGIRGSASYDIFYKTTGRPEPSYVTGPRDISDGVLFEPDKNVLTLKADGVSYSYTFDPDTPYSAEEFAALLNDKFENGDDNSASAPLEASIENGRLKITHKLPGSHTITDISGSAKGIVFYQEDSRSSLNPYMLQVGALGFQGLELPRLRVNTVSLGINSVIISKVKYAEKALSRLNHALDLLSERRSTYGVLQNRIEFLTSANTNTSINLQASESKMRDTDMASEMTEYLKNQMMAQASEAVLAQANQLPDRILSLLQ